MNSTHSSATVLVCRLRYAATVVPTVAAGALALAGGSGLGWAGFPRLFGTTEAVEGWVEALYRQRALCRSTQQALKR